MNLNAKKGTVLILIGFLINIIGRYILGFVFNLFGLWRVGSILSLIIGITFLTLGILQLFKVIDIDNYFNLSKFLEKDTPTNNFNLTDKLNHSINKITENKKQLPQTIKNKTEMNYKVVPFNQTKNINQELQSIIDNNSNEGWEYVSHKYEHYLKPGTDGCFGFGSKPDTVWHVGHVVFKKV